METVIFGPESIWCTASTSSTMRSVNLFAVAYANYQYRQFFVECLVDDPIVADPQSSQPAELSFQRRAGRTLVRKPIHSGDYAVAVAGVCPPNRLSGARFDLDRVGRA